MLKNLLQKLGRMEWIRFGIRDRIIRKFFNPESTKSEEFEISSFFDLNYRGNLNSFIDWTVFFYGAYEKENLKLIGNILDKNQCPVFIDIGANVGHHSLFASKYCDVIHSFEPNHSLLVKLGEKIKINSLTNIITHDIALGDTEEELTYFAPSGCNQGTGSFNKDHNDNNVKSEKYKIFVADDFISKLDLNHINLIKIDVEGFEKNVLSGLKSTMKKHRPTLIVEFSETTKNSFQNLTELKNLLPENYKINTIKHSKPYFFIFNRAAYSIEEFNFDIPGGDLLISPI